MRILMASLVDPAVQLGGAWTVTRGLLTLLRTSPLGAEVEVVAVRRRTPRGHLVRQVTALAQSLATGLPSKIAFHREREVLAGVTRLLSARSFDLMVLNGTDMLWLLPHLPDAIAKVLVAHNIEHRLFAAQLRWRFPHGHPATPIFERDCERLRRYEGDGVRRIGHVIFLSSADAECARIAWPGLHMLTLPPLFEGGPARRPPRSPGDRRLAIGMIANFEWWPNRQGLDWFMREVFPHLSVDVTLHLFGRPGASSVAPHPRVIVHGPVDRLEEAWPVCDVMMCPILSGGGVSIKLAEAIYRRIPVLATSFAARGLPLTPDASVVLLDTAAEWIACLNEDGVRLAAQTVPQQLAARFDIDTHAVAVADFLEACTTWGGARAATEDAAMEGERP